jgi:hypothetical protein
MHKTLALTILLLGTVSLSAQARKASAVSALPQIVAKVSLRNQSASVPITSIFTPTAAGLYRLSAYSVETIPVGANDSWSMAIFWTDDFGPESAAVLSTPFSGGWGSPGSGFPPGSVTVFRAMAGRPVKYSVELCQSCQGGTYSLYFVVEQLM